MAIATQEILEQLQDGVAQLASSEEWTAWLRTQARFYNYSFGNCMLIARQYPGATMVAGFHRWKELSRFVRKGEHGIKILAPPLCQ